MIRSFPMTLVVFFSLLVPGGCDGARDGSMVPFKQDPAGQAPSSGETPDPNAPSTPKVEVREGESRRHEGGPSLSIDAKTVEVAHARASFTLDLDGDELDDVLVWAGAPDLAPQLWLARGTATGFGKPQAVDRSRVALADGCTPGETTITRLSEDKAVLRGEVTCSEEHSDEAKLLLLIFTVEHTPRVLERIALRDAVEGTTPRLSEVRAQDIDGDGHADVQLVLAAETGELRMTWLDRPSGLSRQSDEPEATLGALAAAAEKKLEDDPAAAAQGANAARRLYEQLCRKPGRAVISVAGVWGLHCGSSTAAGQASLVAARALVAQGKVVEAMQALEQLDRDGIPVEPGQRERAVEALGQRAETPRWKLVPIASMAVPHVTPAFPPPLRFLDDKLWLGSTPPRMWDPARREESPSLDIPAQETRYTDPSGQYTIRHIDRDCEGRLLRITDQTGATTRARARQEVGAVGCALRVPVPDAGDLRVLGWAPQGVVLADREGALLVPLDAQATPTEPPRRLPLDSPLPAPLPEGRASATGACSARPTAFGVLVTTYGRAGRRLLVRPPDWDDLNGPVREAIIDNRCERLAIATSRQIYLLEPQ